MRAEYTERPEAVAVFPHEQGTDIFLRRDITREEGEEGAAWVCDEAQTRVYDPVTAEEVAADFATWWEIASGDAPPKRQTTDERLAQLRADVDFLAVMTGIDLEV